MQPDDPARARILDAAQAMLDERAGPLRLVDVAARAGLSRASLYRRFATREELLAALRAERGVAAGEPGLDLRRTILAGAREAFNTSGLGGASMDEVAARAGVGVASVYRHFADKAGLLRALFAEAGIDGLIKRLEASTSTPLEGLLRMAARGIIGFLLDHRFAAAMIIDSNVTTREIMSRVRETSALRLTPPLTAVLARRVRGGEIAAGEDPRTIAVTLVGMCIAAVALVPATADDPEAAAARVARQLARGIASSSR